MYRISNSGGIMRKQKYTIEEAKEIFCKEGCNLLENTYINNNTPMRYICSCGNEAITKMRFFQSGTRCKHCRYQRAMETATKNNGGTLPFRSKKFIEERKKMYANNPSLENKRMDSIRNHNREKYGADYFVQTQEGKNKIRSTMKEKYGVEFPHQLESAKEKFKETLMTKYGVPNLAYLSRPASKQSQKLFWEIHKQLSLENQQHSYFAELNSEFVICYEKIYYKYDFVNTKLLKAIEFNGLNFHPHERQDEEVGWCAFHPKLTAKQARENEKHKYDGLYARKFEILTVWDYEYRKDFNALVKKCLDFLTQGIQLT
jgi:hypothetical protein